MRLMVTQSKVGEGSVKVIVRKLNAVCEKCGYQQEGDTKRCRNCNAEGTLRALRAPKVRR